MNRLQKNTLHLVKEMREDLLDLLHSLEDLPIDYLENKLKEIYKDLNYVEGYIEDTHIKVVK